MICWYHHLLSLVGCMKILLFLLLGCLCWTMYADFSSEDIKQAAELRGKKAYDAAEKILSQYASPAYFHELNPAEKITFVQGVLELAHIYALQNRVDQALLLLSWAESLEDDYLKALCCLKYAEILVGLDEFERAQSYLTELDKIIAKRSNRNQTSGAYFGQGSEYEEEEEGTWGDFRISSQVLKAAVESKAMADKYGDFYGDYVKLRRFQQIAGRSRDPKYRVEALKLADELLAKQSAGKKAKSHTPTKENVFIAAAGYLKGELLFENLNPASSAAEINAVKQYLTKFVDSNPEGIYRGETLLLLGRLTLELEQNASNAEKYYSRAYQYFTAARKKKDALDLFLPLKNDLKAQVSPDKKLNSLSRWKRIVYHEEDPLKLYNTANAPSWYLDTRERDCIYILGFLTFLRGDYKTAQSYWEKILSLSPDIAALDQRLPNVQTRLLKACRLHAMAFWPEEKEKIRDQQERLRLQYAEFLILQEKHKEARAIFEELTKSDNEFTVAASYMGIAQITDLMGTTHDSKLVALKYSQKVLGMKKVFKTPLYAKALRFSAGMTLGGKRDYREALKLYQKYNEMFPDGRERRRALYYTAYCHLKLKQRSKAQAIYEELKSENDVYSYNLKRKLSASEQTKGK